MIQTPIAWTIRHAEHGHLALKSKNRALHVRLAKQAPRVVYQIAGGEIVSAIDDNVEILEELKRVLTGQFRFERLDLNVGIEIREARLRGGCFRFTNIIGTKSYLALKIGEIHYIEIDQAQVTNPSCCEVQP